MTGEVVSIRIDNVMYANRDVLFTWQVNIGRHTLLGTFYFRIFEETKQTKYGSVRWNELWKKKNNATPKMLTNELG